MTGSTARRAAHVVLAGVVALTWAQILRLAVLLWNTDLAYRYVAVTSRLDAPWYYRVSALWGGAEGSMLLFAGVVALAGLLAMRRASLRTAWVVVGFVASLSGVALLLASPFARLPAPAIAGRGLTPILEHPAMAVHPPLLYIGLASTLVAAARVADGKAASQALRVAICVIGAAMVVGGLWSYVEQGWGGYWAWDPVENTSLIVWLLAVAAVHRPMGSALGAAPWVATLLGASVVRSGSVPSVHAFARHGTIGWSLFALSGAASMWLAVRSRVVRVAGLDLDQRAVGESPVVTPTDRARRHAVVTLGAIAALVGVGTYLPVVVGWFRATPVVGGTYFARATTPLGVALAALIAAALWKRRHADRRVLAAHAGIVVLLAGCLFSAADRYERATVAIDRTVTVAGVEVVVRRIDVEPGPVDDSRAVVAELLVEGRSMKPSLVAYPQLGGVLAETAVRVGWWTDTQAALVTADDNGTAVVDIHRRPGMALVWGGAAITTVATIPGRRRRRGADGARPVH